MEIAVAEVANEACAKKKNPFYVSPRHFHGDGCIHAAGVEHVIRKSVFILCTFLSREWKERRNSGFVPPLVQFVALFVHASAFFPPPL